MPRYVRSAKGELVDLDLLAIKQQMADTPKSMVVQIRENYIEQRLNRKAKLAAGLIDEDVINYLSSEQDLIQDTEQKPIKQKAK